MALYDTVKMNINQYHHGPLYIFIENLNSLYLLNSELDIFLHIITILTKLLYWKYKVCEHFNIIGNKKANELAKAGNKYKHRLDNFPHEATHFAPYFLHKDVLLDNNS